MKDYATEFRKDTKDYTEGFRKVVLDPDLLDRLTETAGNKTDAPPAPEGMRVLWDTLCVFQGWKLQKNYYFSHWRILDEYGRKKAAGGEEEMLGTLKSIAGLH
jgi:hypothetical protein